MDLISDLVAIGFTEYEAKVYVALLRESPATGYQVSKNSGVPRSMVYEALGRLDVRGAVLKTDDRRATLYRPVPPDILLDRFQKEHQNLLADLRQELSAIFDARQEDHFWSIQGRGSVQSFANQMLEKSRKDLLLVLNDDDLDYLRPKLLDADAKGVEISALLTGLGTLECGQVVRHPPLESERQELQNMLVIVSDQQQVLIANKHIETTATITTNPNLVLIARQFVWMELFAQRIYAQMGSDLMDRLSPEDREILAVYAVPEETK